MVAVWIVVFAGVFRDDVCPRQDRVPGHVLMIAIDVPWRTPNFILSKYLQLQDKCAISRSLERGFYASVVRAQPGLAAHGARTAPCPARHAFPRSDVAQRRGRGPSCEASHGGDTRDDHAAEKTLPYHTAITGTLCTQAAADCDWVTTKPYK